jgi:cytochrome c
MEVVLHIFFAIAMLALSSAFASFATAAEDTSGGQVVFNNACRTCHSVKKDDNRLGPNLNAIIGRKAGSVPGYAYSSSMRNSGITWDAATLDKFIANPDKVVANNNMKPFGGITDAEQRKQIVQYLESNPN